jgi:AmmeMemoRadiSam system protein A
MEKKIGILDEFIFKINHQHGEKLKRIAKDAIESYVLGKSNETVAVDSLLNHKAGAFVTIREHGELRGCIGRVYPTDSLVNTVRKVAVEAAIDDPRFSPLRPDELRDIEIEVTVLGDLVSISPQKQEDIDSIVIGEDGLMVSDGYYSGLLLPQVALEFNMNRIQFLEETCIKAGLSRDAWKSPRVHVYKFKGRVF